jgi:phytoene desaturase
MNYADIKGGTWYPDGGMYAVVEGMFRLAKELGVYFRFNEEVKEIRIAGKQARQIVTSKDIIDADAVISGADYHFTETSLLPPEYRTYKESYWSKKVMAPSCLMYYVGLNKKLKQKIHHSLFFDAPFDQHGIEIYKDPRWPSKPLFYVSVQDEAIVFLIPVASGLENDTEELREKYFQQIVNRMEQHTGEKILDHIIYKKTYSVSDFVNDYHSYRGNAYGLANTLKQTAVFRPSCRSKKVKNLFYTGQMTVPGPGVPPCLISGEVAAREVVRIMKQ